MSQEEKLQLVVQCKNEMALLGIFLSVCLISSAIYISSRFGKKRLPIRIARAAILRVVSRLLKLATNILAVIVGRQWIAPLPGNINGDLLGIVGKLSRGDELERIA